MVAVTVPGVGLSTISIEATGTANQFVSQSLANLLRQALDNSTLTVNNYAGGLVPPPSGSGLNELIVTVSGLNFSNCSPHPGQSLLGSFG